MKRWQIGLGLVVSAVFVWWALNGLNLAEVVRRMREANYWWLIPSIAVYFVAVWVRTWRWDYMLRPLKRIPVRQLFPVVVIGYAGNNILPFRAGELLRSYVLYRREGVSISASLATVIVERVFDGLVMLVFVFVALPLAPIPSAAVRSTVAVASGLFFAALLIFFALAAFPERSYRLAHAVFGRILPLRLSEPLLDFTQRFLSGLASLRHFRNVLMIFFTSLLIWLLETVKYWFVMHAFDFQVSFFALMLMNGIVNLATTLPSAPGYVGTFDQPGIEILKLYNVPPNTAGAYTLVLHAALWLPITVLGLFLAAREGLYPRHLSAAIQLASASQVASPGEKTQADV